MEVPHLRGIHAQYEIRARQHIPTNGMPSTDIGDAERNRLALFASLVCSARPAHTPLALSWVSSSCIIHSAIPLLNETFELYVAARWGAEHPSRTRMTPSEPSARRPPRSHVLSTPTGCVRLCVIRCVRAAGTNTRSQSSIERRTILAGPRYRWGGSRFSPPPAELQNTRVQRRGHAPPSSHSARQLSGVLEWCDARTDK